MVFSDKFKALQIRLRENKDLQDFCLLNFNKQMHVKGHFRKRVEISLSELPYCFLTRPAIKRQQRGQLISREHSVTIYAGFHCDDKEKAVDLMIDFEELIEKALVTKTNLSGDMTMPVFPGESLNDEGKFHPVYFVVMECTVKEL